MGGQRRGTHTSKKDTHFFLWQKKSIFLVKRIKTKAIKEMRQIEAMGGKSVRERSNESNKK